MKITKTETVHYTDYEIQCVEEKLHGLKYDHYLRFIEGEYHWVMPAYIMLSYIADELCPRSRILNAWYQPTAYDIVAIKQAFAWYKKQIIRDMKKQVVGYRDFERVKIKVKVKHSKTFMEERNKKKKDDSK